MGKNKQIKSHESGKLSGNARHIGSDKAKRDGTPKNDEDHFNQIPFRLREIMKSKELMKKGTFRTRKIKAVIPKTKAEDSAVEDIHVPHFKRRNNESKKSYLGRMENETKHILFLTKNQVERKPELEEEKQEKPANKGKSEKKREYNKGRLQRLHQKKLNRQEEELEKDMFIDKVNFGEVAMAPPTLSVKPKKAPVKNTSKDLLLNSLLGHTVASTAKPSMARQRIMEEERQRVVEAYRHLKRQKQSQRELIKASLATLKNL